MERLTFRGHKNQAVLRGMACNYSSVSFDCQLEEGRELLKLALEKLATYEDAEEQGLLLRLPCDYNESLFWVVNGNIKEVWFKGIRCDKGYKPQIIARYLEGLSSKEEPITKLENIGKTVFLTKEEAGKTLAERKNDE